MQIIIQNEITILTGTYPSKEVYTRIGLTVKMPNPDMGNLGKQKPTIINNRHGKAIGVRRVREKHNNCFSINLNVNII